tara:strand:- start:1282 stop:2172 length:891 start_codon:yes stop_codon:yes gene_type:complete
MKFTIKQIILVILVVVLVRLIIISRKEGFSQVSDKKVCVILFGFAPRSFKYVHKTIKSRIIDVLRKKFSKVSVYHYSLLSKKGSIESNRLGENGMPINNDDVKLMPVDKMVTEYQEDIDIQDYVYKSCGQERNHKINPLRQFYQESMLQKVFPVDDYDACVAVTSDSYCLKDVNIQHVLDVCDNDNIIYTTAYNKAYGLANGFYICSPYAFKKVTNRINYYKERCKMLNGGVENPEQFLKYSVEREGLKNKDTDFFYLKIRANKKNTSYIPLMEKNGISKKTADEMRAMFGGKMIK